jgi:hypothetical protein
MITPESAQNIVKNFAEKLKASKSFNPFSSVLPMAGLAKIENKTKDELAEMPELWPGYRFAVRQMRDIMSHTQRDVFPKHLFLDMGPHAKKRDIEFARLNFKAITLPVWIDFKNTIMRAFQDGNWSVNYHEQDDFQNYVENDVPLYYSIEAFRNQILTPIKLQDPNGLIAIKPYSISYQVDADGNIVADDEGRPLISDDLLQPYPVYYSSKNIIAQKEGSFYAVVSGEKSMVVNDKGELVPEGIVIEIYDDTNIYRIEQTGKKVDYKFSDPVIYFNHNLGYIPATKLKGVPVLIPDAVEEIGLLWNSPFAYAVDNLDKVLTDDAVLEIVKKKCAFPYMVAVGMPCDFEMNGNKCEGGKIWDMDANKHHICPSCQGTGMKNRLSPSGELLVNTGSESLTNVGDTRMTGDFIKFVAPDTAIFEFLENQKKDNENRARRILHIKDVDGRYVYSADKTATASDNDMKAMYAFIQPISDQIFDIYTFILDAIGEMRYGDRYEPVTVIAPQSFDLSTSSDYLDLIAQLTDAGAPPTVIREFMHKYLKSMFYSDVESAQILEIIMAADNLMPFSSEVIAAKVERGVAEIWQEILHDQAFNLIQEVISEVPNYLQLEMGEQIDKLQEKAKSKVPAQNNDLATQLLNGLGA